MSEYDERIKEINACPMDCLCDYTKGGCAQKKPNGVIPVLQIESGSVVRDPDAVVKIKSDGGSSEYYQIPPGAKEIQDLVEHRNMNFAVGNIFKAAYRLGKKAGNDDLYEIRKIIWYANRELNRLQQEKA